MDQRISNPSPEPTIESQQTKAQSHYNAIDEQPRDPRLTTSVPSPAALLSSDLGVDNEETSNSEPTLRFPRPQGNKRLANWISSSDPNIMDQASEGESGLAGSTYELINKEEGAPQLHQHTDSELQDDAQDVFDESVSESVGSLDQYRQDDVQSLASTEGIEEEEDDQDGHPHNYYYNDHDDKSASFDDEGSRFTDRTYVNQEQSTSGLQHADDIEDHSEAESRSSIEYTRQSLGTPSVMTPEASKILGTMPEDPCKAAEKQHEQEPGQRPPTVARRNLKTLVSDAVDSYLSWPNPKEVAKGNRELSITQLMKEAICTVRNNARQIAVMIFCVLLGCLLVIAPASKSFQRNAVEGDIPLPDDVTAITTITTTHATVATTNTDDIEQVAPPKTGVALVPLYDSGFQPRLFGMKPPSVSFVSAGSNDVAVYFNPPSFLKAWKGSPDCFDLKASREGRSVPFEIDLAQEDNAIHLSFDGAQAYGIVEVNLTSKCRPKFEKLVKVHFGKGVMEQFSDCMGELASILTGLAPATDSVVHRCPALSVVPHSIDSKLTAAKDSAMEMISSRFHAATESLGPLGQTLELAAREADRRLDQASKMLYAVSCHTEKTFLARRFYGAQVAQDSMIFTGRMLSNLTQRVTSGAKIAVQKATASQYAHQASFKKAVSKIGVDVNGVQDQLRFGLLDAQVAARTWWLSVTGRQVKSEEYRRRAQEFIDELHASSKQQASVASKIKPKRCGQWSKSEC